MRKIRLLFAAALSMIAWTGMMAQTAAEHEAALAAIEDGAQYRIFTEVDGTKYYVTAGGTLTAEKNPADFFTLKKIAEGGQFVVNEEDGTVATGIQVTSTSNTQFTNAPLSGEKAVLEVANFSTTNQSRPDWESQVFFLKEGKFAIRSCNTPYGESSWQDTGRTFWTYAIGEAVTPLYSYEPAYVWELEKDEFAALQVAAKAKTSTWEELILSTSKRLISSENPWVSDAADSSEGCLDCLIDDNLSSFFHSDWHGAFTGGTHYIEAALPEAKNGLFLYYVTRSNGTGCPKNITVSASTDGETWEDDLATINDADMPQAASLSYLSKGLTFEKDYSYFRFYVHSTNSTTEGWFCLAEANLYTATALTTEAMSLARTAVYELSEEEIARIDALDTELRSTTIKVTYELYDSDGTFVSKVEVTQEKNSNVEIPAAWASNSKFFDYTAEGTVGETDCTITVKRTLKAGFVGSLADLSNSKAYTITCDRGSMLTNGTTIASTAHADYASAEPGKFAILNYEDKYYLYSVADSKFVTNEGALSDKLANGVFDAIVMDPKTTPYFMFSFKIDEGTNYGVNTNGSGNLGGIVINNWMTADQGNQYYMVEAADFDATSALAALDAYFHPAFTVTYVVKDTEGNVLFTSDPEPSEEGAKVTTLPAKYQRGYYTYNEVDVTVSQANTVAEFTATWNGPFTISADFASAHWHNMTMRGTWYVTTDVKDGDGAYKTQNANTMGLGEDSYQWAFIGNGYDGFKIVNKAEGDGKSFGWTDAAKSSGGIPTVMDDSEGYHAWKIVASTNTSVPANSFCLNVPGTNLYINQYGGAGGSVKFWDSTNNIGDPGSAFTVYEVPTNFAEYVVSEVAPVMEAAGYFTFTEAAKAAIGYDPAYKENCPFDAFKSMKAKINEAMGDVSNFILPESGYYTLKNKMYGTFLGIDPSDANLYGNYKTATAAKQVVTLVRTGADTYAISLMGKFAPAAVAQSQQVTAAAEAANYTVTVPAVGFAAFSAVPGEQYSALHCASGGSVVGWEAPADASMWSATEAAAITLTIGEEGYATAYLPFPVEIGKTITVPAAKGTWTFDDGTTAGTGSATMEASEGVVFADGTVKVDKGQKLTITTGLGTTGTYTIMFDVKSPDVTGYSSFFTNDPNNGKDGSFFIKDGKIGLNGTGLRGYYGAYTADEWHRVVFSCENSQPTIYMDGKLLKVSEISKDEHWLIQNVLLLFADNDGEEKEIVADKICFWDVALTEAEVTMLGTYGTEIPEPQSVAAYTGEVVTNYLALNPVEEEIPAFTAVVLKAEPGVYEFAIPAAEGVPYGALGLYDVVVDGSTALVKGWAAPEDNNALKGTLEPIDAVGKYVLAKPEGKDICFYLAESGQIAAGKAYLELDSEVKAFYFNFDGNATGITNVEKAIEDGLIYNIAGQRVNKAQKGINIVNGKKVLF